MSSSHYRRLAGAIAGKRRRGCGQKVAGRGQELTSSGLAEGRGGGGGSSAVDRNELAGGGVTSVFRRTRRWKGVIDSLGSFSKWRGGDWGAQVAVARCWSRVSTARLLCSVAAEGGYGGGALRQAIKAFIASGVWVRVQSEGAELEDRSGPWLGEECGAERRWLATSVSGRGCGSFEQSFGHWPCAIGGMRDLPCRPRSLATASVYGHI